ncbi:hypothetical protein AUEXF2481DRAFT_524757 [Aureobasidium subglaciale EXF-2481]|uniref:Uncharacterized protein n=1 Tax=Aureobasidium subglaciale (strain EXF-2481) TaxID=1043005 RepID=A0A074Y9L8_AURSE|nr:uncharacterized protein AUEXF2481DRAFT_524757 [Aureobasidium subglaciale EXF-2481]KEQ90887.1 hypothetical protein AUEXF2481DRAFT_524757 [Aureobasidium subglaciale EXF-2481]
MMLEEMVYLKDECKAINKSSEFLACEVVMREACREGVGSNTLGDVFIERRSSSISRFVGGDCEFYAKTQDASRISRNGVQLASHRVFWDFMSPSLHLDDYLCAHTTIFTIQKHERLIDEVVVFDNNIHLRELAGADGFPTWQKQPDRAEANDEQDRRHHRHQGTTISDKPT